MAGSLELDDGTLHGRRQLSAFRVCPSLLVFPAAVEAEIAAAK